MNKRRIMQLRMQLAKEFNDETGLSPDNRHEWEQWLKRNGHWPVIPAKTQTTAQPFCVQVEDTITPIEQREDLKEKGPNSASLRGPV